jgi:ABC-type sugar transport system substrate-binding protein
VQVFVADNDGDKQVRQVQACLGEPPERRLTVVLVSPVREVALFNAARAAARLGIGWVMLLRWCDYVRDLRAEFPDLPIFTVTPDQHEVCRIQGRQFRALLPGGGEAVYIRGPLGTSSAARRFAGAQEVLQDSSIELSILDSDFTLAGGESAMRDWLRMFPRAAPTRLIVGAQNDAMAMGARTALEEHTKGRANFSLANIAICGCDGSPAYGQRLVREGKLTSTVIMPPTAGRAVAEIATTTRGVRPAEAIVLSPVAFPEARRLRPIAP